MAVDDGLPPKHTIASLLIEVQRNLRRPNFTQSIFEDVILETDPIGKIVLRVIANDADNFVCFHFYSILIPKINRICCPTLGAFQNC